MPEVSEPTLIARNAWKLWAFALMIAVAGVALFFPNMVGNVLQVEAVAVQFFTLGASALLLCWIIYAIRCPYCNLHLVSYAMSHQPIGDWLQWLLTVKTCPNCQRSRLH